MEHEKDIAQPEYSDKIYASPYSRHTERKEPEAARAEERPPDDDEAGAGRPDTVNPDTEPYSQQPYAYPYARPYAHQQYAQQPYAQPPYMQQQYAYEPYAQPGPYGRPYGPPPGQAFGQSPYSQFAQAQSGQKETEPKKRKKEKNRRERPDKPAYGRGNMAVLVVVIIIACLASGIGGGLIGANLTEGKVVTVESGPSLTIEPSNDITTTEAIAKKALASVVGVTTTTKYTSNDFFFGPSEQEIMGVGTGMIIDSKGYILTNSHVVMDGNTESITVHLSSGEEVQGRLIWNDTGLDLAIVKIDSTGLQPIELGDSSTVAIGSYVAAIGNPLGLEFSGSITAGVVSGLDRTVTVSDEWGGSQLTMHDLIQVDAAINSGNSGGPLLNSRGQVIGINTAKATAEGMGFAIPINTATPIVEKVLRDGNFERVFMGVSAADVQVIKDNYPNVELKADQGACITDVGPGSPAEKGGLKVKDVITAIDGTEISGSASLIKLLLSYSSGDTVTVTYNRDGEILETQVTLLSQSELDKAQQEENPFRTPERGNSGR